MKFKDAFPAAVILLMGAWIFSPAIHGDWIWDDGPEIVQNADLRSGAGLARIWIAPASPDYFPLKATVQWAEWHLWGGASPGYHLVSLALHLLSALLFWRLLRQLGVRFAWLGGLIFTIHPLAVESVAWISEQKNLLSLPPLLLAMSAYVDFDGRRARGDYLRALAWFLAALLCKTSVVMLPVVLLLYAWWKRGRVSASDLRASAPFFALSAGLGLVTLWFQWHRAIAGAGPGPDGWAARIAGAGLAAAFYLYKSVVPLGLIPIYPRWNLAPPAPWQFLPWVAWAVLLGWLWSRRATWGRGALLGLGFFLVNLVPVLGFAPMSYLRISRVADHFAYLPLLGLIGLVPALVGVVADRSASWTSWRIPLGVGAAALCAALALVSHRQDSVFLSEESLWTYTADHNPGSGTAHNNLGKVRFREGRLADAIAEFQKGLQFDAGNAEAQFNLGLALADAGRPAEAIGPYERALQLNPGFAEGWECLANAQLAGGHLAEALAGYAVALRLRPAYPEAHANRGVALAEEGRLPESIAEFERALLLNPDFPEAHCNLGNALVLSGRLADAAAQYEAALRLKPDYAQARERLAQVRARLAPAPPR